MMAFWSRRKAVTVTDDNPGLRRYNHLLCVASKLPPAALPDLLRAIARPIQSDFLLAVAEEGTDARPDLDPDYFFFSGLPQVMDYERMKENSKDPDRFTLSLATDMILPWPWSLPRYISALSHIGCVKGSPWKQDQLNHYVDLWLPWRIGFVTGGNHSIAAGILAGEGHLVPSNVYDMSFLFQTVRTDGRFWYINGEPCEPVTKWRSAAVFEIGRSMKTQENPLTHND